MSMTSQRMSQILKEIEGEGAVGLGAAETQEELACRAPEQLEMKALCESRRRMNECYEVKLEASFGSQKPIVGKVVTAIKHVIRKVILSVMAPVWLDQNRFNASAATTVNWLSENQLKIAEFVKKQEETNLENQLLREEVERLRQDLADVKMELVKTQRRLK